MRSSGRGPTLVFFAGALANHDLWRDVVAALEDRYRCITIDLPLGAHPWPLTEGADRTATSLARLLLDCLQLLDVEDATVVANDTAGGLLLLSLATGHPALGRVGRLVLTNCDSYDQFPPDALRGPAAVCRTLPRLARALLRLQLRSSTLRNKTVSTVAASGLDHERATSFFGQTTDRVAAGLLGRSRVHPASRSGPSRCAAVRDGGVTCDPVRRGLPLFDRASFGTQTSYAGRHGQLWGSYTRIGMPGRPSVSPARSRPKRR